MLLLPYLDLYAEIHSIDLVAAIASPLSGDSLQPCSSQGTIPNIYLAEQSAHTTKTMENIEMALPLGSCLMMDEDAASIVAQIKTLLRQLRTKGATDKEIDSILADEEKPGRAYIDSAGMLVLPDAGNTRIKLTPMERTLYILLLRYPNGINADELWRYWDELCDIYGSQTVYDDIDLIEDAVEGICDEEKVTWYTNVSRIKRKITDKLGKRAAEQYIIKRGTNGLYRIDALSLTIEGQ